MVQRSGFEGGRRTRETITTRDSGVESRASVRTFAQHEAERTQPFRWNTINREVILCCGRPMVDPNREAKRAASTPRQSGDDNIRAVGHCMYRSYEAKRCNTMSLNPPQTTKHGREQTQRLPNLFVAGVPLHRSLGDAFLHDQPLHFRLGPDTHALSQTLKFNGKS